MTKKDYKIIAGIMKRAHQPIVRTDSVEFRIWAKIVNDLCYSLAKDNPLFSEEKFREACGIK